MSLYANVNNSKKEVTGLFGNVNGAKKEIVSLWANKDGKPVQIFGSGAGNVIKAIPKGFCLVSIVSNYSELYIQGSPSKWYYNYGPSTVILVNRNGRKIKLSIDQGTNAAYAFRGAFCTSFDNSANKKYFVQKATSKMPQQDSVYTNLMLDGNFANVQQLSGTLPMPCYYIDGNRKMARVGRYVYTGEGRVIDEAFPSASANIVCSGTKYSVEYSRSPLSPVTSVYDFFNGKQYKVYPSIDNVYAGQDGDTKHNVRGRLICFSKTKVGDVVLKGCRYSTSYNVYKNEMMVYLYNDFSSTWTLDDEHLIFESSTDSDVAAMLPKEYDYDSTVAEGLCTSSLIVFVSASGTQLTVTELLLNGTSSRRAVDVSLLIEEATDVRVVQKNVNAQGSGLLVAIGTSSKRFIYSIDSANDLASQNVDKWIKVLEYDLPAKLTDPILSKTPESTRETYERLMPISDNQLDELVIGGNWTEIQ